MKLIIKPPKSREDRRLEAMQREFDEQDKLDHEEWLKILADIKGVMRRI